RSRAAGARAAIHGLETCAALARRTPALHRQMQMAAEQAVFQRERGPTDRLSDVLEVFAGFEANSPARRNADFLPSARVAADAALAWLHLEDAKAAKFNAFAALHRNPHGVED